MRLIAMGLVGCALVGASVAPAAAQGRVGTPVIVDRPMPSGTIREDFSLRSRQTGFGSMPSTTGRTRIVTEDSTGRRSQVIIEEAPVSAGIGTHPRAAGSFSSVPAFDRDIRITTDGAPAATPIIILPIMPRR